MNKILITFFVTFIINSCVKKTENEEFPKFDKNGQLIVYNANVYAELWMKNRNLKVTMIDTFCINQTKRATNDIKNGKLIYSINKSFEFEILKKKLLKYGIETKEFYGTCIRWGSFEPYCYQNEMWKEIDKKFGEKFIDSLSEIAKKEFVLENPNVGYMEDGIDLREKYKNK
jgi:hypothetical protein